jgi:hypothetical protein
MRYICIVLVLLIFGACGTGKQNKLSVKSTMISNQLPALIIYKTKKDYSNLVPVILSSDKKQIIGYPHPIDVINDSSYNYPTSLFNGYWIDNIGITENTGFINISLEDYSKKNEPPSVDEMMAKLVDVAPFLEIWNCGYGIELNISELNMTILTENLEDHFKRIY